MRTCITCGRENPDDARFCANCGSALEDSSGGAPREERKVVTVLFADLVGFTSRSEQLDPEDVRATLTPYFARLREELERRGGTVEKFIGDAVMAVFGAPIAARGRPRTRRPSRARDPRRDRGDERARSRARPARPRRRQHGRGPRVARARTRSRARAWRRATWSTRRRASRAPRRSTGSSSARRRIARQSAPSSTDQASRWTRKGRPSGSRRGRRSKRELASASTSHDESTRRSSGATESSPCFATRWTGLGSRTSPSSSRSWASPGIGKSRLVHELYAHIDTLPDLITWRQGRSLPYGEGVSYWALGEIVKAEAGILETDADVDHGREARSDGGRADPRGARARVGGSPPRPTHRALAGGAPGAGGIRRGSGRVAAVPRIPRRATAHRADLRGPALGRRRSPGLPRLPAGLDARRAAARRRHGASGAPRPNARAGAEGSRTPRRSRSLPCRTRTPPRSSRA